MSIATNTRTASTRDRSYVISLGKKFSNMLGTLSFEAIDKRLELGHIEIATQNAAPCGYILWAEQMKGARHVRPIFQAAVQMDAQRRHHGLALLRKIEAKAREDRKAILQCWCRQGLDANDFWKAAGFIAVAFSESNAQRGEPRILWRRPLLNLPTETLMLLPRPAANIAPGGRALRKSQYNQLPEITVYAQAQVSHDLERTGLSA